MCSHTDYRSAIFMANLTLCEWKKSGFEKSPTLSFCSKMYRFCSDSLKKRSEICIKCATKYVKRTKSARNYAHFQRYFIRFFISSAIVSSKYRA